MIISFFQLNLKLKNVSERLTELNHLMSTASDTKMDQLNRLRECCDYHRDLLEDERRRLLLYILRTCMSDLDFLCARVYGCSN